MTYCMLHKKTVLYLSYIQHSGLTSQETKSPYIKKSNRLVLLREIVGGYCENQTKHVNTKYGKIKEFLNVKGNCVFCYKATVKYYAIH
jgi:hypothetical protein